MAKNKRQMKAMAAVHYDLFTPEKIDTPAPATLSHRQLDQMRRQQQLQRLRESAQVADVSSSVVDLTPSQPTSISGVRSKRTELPDVEELQRRFDYYNVVYFKGRLPKVRIEYSKRMTSAGSYTPSLRLIKIGKKYHEIFPEDLNDTLKHEMIHIRHYRHDAKFKAEANRIGCSMRAQCHPELRRPAKYLYECPACKAEYPRQKRLVMASCGDCSKRGKFDERFKLRLKSSKVREAAK